MSININFRYVYIYQVLIHLFLVDEYQDFLNQFLSKSGNPILPSILGSFISSPIPEISILFFLISILESIVAIEYQEREHQLKVHEYLNMHQF